MRRCNVLILMLQLPTMLAAQSSAPRRLPNAVTLEFAQFADIYASRPVAAFDGGHCQGAVAEGHARFETRGITQVLRLGDHEIGATQFDCACLSIRSTPGGGEGASGRRPRLIFSRTSGTPRSRSSANRAEA